MIASFSITFGDTLEGAATVTFILGIVSYVFLSLTVPIAIWAHIQTKGGHRVPVEGDTTGKVETRRHTPNYMARCGAAYENYRKNRHWFGALYIAKKFVMASIIGFLTAASGIQIVILVVVELAYFGAFLATQPTDDRVVWILEAVVSLFAAINFALLIPYTDFVDDPSEASTAFAAITIIIQFLLMGSTVAVLIYKVYMLVKGDSGAADSTKKAAPMPTLQTPSGSTAGSDAAVSVSVSASASASDAGSAASSSAAAASAATSSAAPASSSASGSASSSS